ncbi:uncharacterized protein RJT20DRAFT_130343 [Scheffersomyces xylosifermentans]|uniref:uncharacterized protein n=1 Tax=Scheffersomyces xylosifermentans TaxID=1304137 RepID=UPI00315CE6B8
MFRGITSRSARAVVGKNWGSPSSIQPITAHAVRFYSNDVPPMDDYENKIYNILKEEFEPKALSVKDVSGGCGSMFAISVESEKFKGKPMIKQHRLVNELLKDEIKQWHGLQLQTKAV